MSIILLSNEWSKNLGILIIRVGLGLIFMNHGYGKLMGGPEVWQGIGMAVHNLGITFAPTLWGLIAACSEFFGGLLLVLGLGTRLATFFLSCVMVVALNMHMIKSDTFAVFAHPLSLLVILIGLFVAGAGALSLDNWLYKRKQNIVQ